LDGVIGTPAASRPVHSAESAPLRERETEIRATDAVDRSAALEYLHLVMDQIGRERVQVEFSCARRKADVGGEVDSLDGDAPVIAEPQIDALDRTIGEALDLPACECGALVGAFAQNQIVVELLDVAVELRLKNIDARLPRGGLLTAKKRRSR
jgi:hypothetical protein